MLSKLIRQINYFKKSMNSQSSFLQRPQTKPKQSHAHKHIQAHTFFLQIRSFKSLNWTHFRTLFWYKSNRPGYNYVMQLSLKDYKYVTHKSWQAIFIAYKPNWWSRIANFSWSLDTLHLPIKLTTLLLKHSLLLLLYSFIALTSSSCH